MGDTTVKLKNASRTLQIPDSRALEVGDLQLPAGGSCRGLVLRHTVRVQAAAAKSGGLSTAQQNAVLNTLSVSFGLMKGSTLWGNRPLNDLKLSVLRRLQNLLFETEPTGYLSSTGLGKPLASGQNTLTFDTYVPTGHVEFIDESILLGGMGASQLAMANLTLTAGPDPLKTLDTDLELKEWKVDLYPDQAPVIPGTERYALPTCYETIVNSDDQEVRTSEGLVYFVADRANPLSASAFGPIRVKVGDYPNSGIAPYVPTDDPCTAKDVEANFAALPDSGTVEENVNLQCTPFYRQADKPLNQVRPGAVTVGQVVKQTNFSLECVYTPCPPSEFYHELARMLAQRTQSGQTVHLVNSAAVLELKVRDELLPYCGMHWMLATHALAQTLPGLRCAYGGEPTVWIPPALLFRAGSQYMAARSFKDKGGMMLAVRSVSDAVPGAVVHPLGYAGGLSWATGEVRRQLELMADTLEAQQR